MLEIALTALTLAMVQETADDPWVEVDGERRRRFTCTVDTAREFRMRGREREPAFRMSEGDRFHLTLHDQDDGFHGITVSPPEGVDGRPERSENCVLEDDGPMFRCNLSLRSGLVLDYYGGLEAHRFTVMWIDDAIGLASRYGSDPSRLDIQAVSGVCLD